MLAEQLASKWCTKLSFQLLYKQ